MRRLALLVATVTAVLLVAPAPPASAGGPTSVLAVDYDGSRAAGALTGSQAYANLEKALDAYTTPTGDATPPASFMDARLRLTWLIHDVTPWRVDAVIDRRRRRLGRDVDEPRRRQGPLPGARRAAPAQGHRPAPRDADLPRRLRRQRGRRPTLGVLGPRCHRRRRPLRRGSRDPQHGRGSTSAARCPWWATTVAAGARARARGRPRSAAVTGTAPARGPPTDTRPLDPELTAPVGFSTDTAPPPGIRRRPRPGPSPSRRG